MHLRATHSVIGDPEIDMWLGKPNSMSFTLGAFPNGLSLSGNGIIDATLSFYDGEGNIVSYTSHSTSQNIQYSGFPTKFDKDTYLISIWKAGYLPEIKLFGQNATLLNKNKKFIVRDASFGSNITSIKNTGKYIISTNSYMTVEAIDGIKAQEGFIVDSGGHVTFECDNLVSLQGCEIKEGGSLQVEAESVIIENGFSVEKGGVLDIVIN